MGNPVQEPLRQFIFVSQVNFFFLSVRHFFQIANFFRPTSSEMKLHVIAFLGTLVISMVSALPVEDGNDLEAVYKAGGADKAPEHEGVRAAEMDESREMSERNDIDWYPFPFPRPLSRGRGKLGHGAVVGIQYES